MQFATQAWADAFRAQIEDSPGYRKSGKGWTHGPIALVVRAAPGSGLPSAIGLWLDLDAGRCREARLVTAAEAARAPYCIEGDYADWKAVLRRTLDPVKAIVARKLSLRGSLFTLLRYVPAALELVACSTRVPTEFPDEEKR